MADVLAAIHEFLTEAPDRMAAINQLRSAIHDLSPVAAQPVDYVRWVPVEQVEPNDYNPNAVAAIEMGLLLRSIDADGYCVEASTPILCADMVWRPARELRQGDLLVGISEEGSGRMNRRRYVRSMVVTNAVLPSPLWRVQTTRGDVLTNAEHPWLARKRRGEGAFAYGGWHWRPTRDLTPGFELAYAMEPWEVDKSWEAGWLAGFLDGEGTLAQNQVASRAGYRGYRLSAYQRPSETADRMVRAIESRVRSKVFTVERSEQAAWSDMVMCRVDKIRDIMRLIGTVQPPRFLDRGMWWDGARFDAEQNVEVTGVMPAEDGEIASLSTTSRTYIAAGFAMHNTQPCVCIWDPAKSKFIVVDGFHRYYLMKTQPSLQARTGGLLPVVVIDKPIEDRMASTVRHNRARGKHSVAGMANMVFKMLDAGMADAAICNELGMEQEELVRLKHITGFAKLFEKAEYQRAWVSRNQVLAKVAQTGEGFKDGQG